MTTHVPALQITTTGVILPDTPTVLGGVLADYNAAFGGNLNITNSGTPQGYLAASLTDNIQAANAAIASLVAGVDPLTADGRMQDAIARIYFLTRNPATATVVTAQCVGQVGATLPAGSLATDGTNIYASLGAVTFAGSPVNVQFACTTLGPIACPANTLTRIAQTVPGWDAVTNAAPGVVGTAVETRAAFEYRREQSVAANAHGSPTSILGEVVKVAGVLDCFVVDNPTGAVVNYGATNYPLAAHSVYVAAVGGADQDIANAIWTKKDLGCNMNGNTTATVTDSSSLAFPYPSYTIKFERPASLAIKFAVQIANHPGLPADIVTQTKTAITNAFTGADGGQRARIGADIYASRYYAGIANISSAVRLLSVKIGTTTANADEVLVGIDQVPTLTTTDIAVTLV